MNIKTFIFNVSARVNRLVHSTFGASAASVPPVYASLDRRPTAYIGNDSLPKANLRKVDTQSQKALSDNKRRNRVRSEVDVLPLDQRRWLTIKEMAVRYPFFSEKALRHLVFSAEAYSKFPKAGLKSNGFIECIIRPAGQRKIIIDTTKFEEWLERGAFSGGSVQGKVSK